jgi:superfamily II DNA/RNA helicase
VLGQAQTGTGKTAAFAMPDPRPAGHEAGKPQALVLAPTRELAIQVAEAFQRYARTCRASTCCRSTAARPMARNWAACGAARMWWSVHPGG